MGQLQAVDVIEQDRVRSWNMYYESLKPLADQHYIELPNIPGECEHNAHMFYIKAKNLEERTRLIEFLNKNKLIQCFIMCHYIHRQQEKDLDDLMVKIFLQQKKVQGC